MTLKLGHDYFFGRMNLLPNFQRNRPAGKIVSSVSFQSTSSSSTVLPVVQHYGNIGPIVHTNDTTVVLRTVLV